MHGYIKRSVEKILQDSLRRSPVTAILGPRQCGKSTLAKTYLKQNQEKYIYLDLQNRVDINKLQEPELFFEKYRDTIICLDEIQRVPDFFSILRSEIDKHRKPGRFLILGSASRDLIRQSNESLAGRIAYLTLTPFLRPEVHKKIDWQTHWLRGGFPESLLSSKEVDSCYWREDFIRTFLERDIPSFGYSIPTGVIEKLWNLLAHYHGQVINFSKLSQAADLSMPTLKKYIYILEHSYMVRILHPTNTNMKKRLIKSPKIYIKDSGILHSLHFIETYDQLLSNPIKGASWEGFAIENIIFQMARWKPSYICTSNNAEIDLIMEKGNRIRVFECKLSKAPKPSKGFFSLIEDLKPEKAYVISPVEKPYEYKKGVWISGLDTLSFSA